MARGGSDSCGGVVVVVLVVFFFCFALFCFCCLAVVVRVLVLVVLVVVECVWVVCPALLPNRYPVMLTAVFLHFESV